VVRDIIFGSLALLSLVLWLWQWFVARRFPLHRRIAEHSFPPAVTLLKPVKGCEPGARECLRSWFEQDYTGRVQILFGVAAADDPVCEVVRALQEEFKHVDSSLMICSPMGANAKVSKLLQLEQQAKHELLIISDADVRVPADFLANFVEPLRTSQKARDEHSKKPSQRACGLTNCFYRLANPTTLAMHWEAICINSDFWSQVLQSRSLKPLYFALGAVMGTRGTQLKEIGGFKGMVDCLADDYELGNRIARLGYKIELSTVVVDCMSSPMGWRKVWNHQLRWSRTIRVCQPAPYFFSVLSNPTLWPLLWLLVHPHFLSEAVCIGCCALRIIGALDLQQRMTQSRKHFVYWWLVPIKDLLQTLIWLLAFSGNRIEWRGQRFRLRRDGTMEKIT
jgi:ceramide glucosyltransferase